LVSAFVCGVSAREQPASNPADLAERRELEAEIAELHERNDGLEEDLAGNLAYITELEAIQDAGANTEAERRGER
jgi:hypothetical protein